ncbi:TniQ family protein [Paracoccus pacificus]|uniref:TniQ family protein n=1 Tax=Paracoccus pacificus TaxID=1463598 RepID=A0ABW4R8B2_9RHOB
MARLAGVDLHGLRFWAPRKLDNGRYRIGATTSSVGAFRRTTIRLCPICAAEALQGQGPSGVFQLLEWCVTCVHRCAVHGARLCEMPAAAHAHETYNVASLAIRHQQVLISAASDPEILDESLFETYIRERIHRGPRDDWLRPLELTHLHRACLMLGLTMAGQTTLNLSAVDHQCGRRACDDGFEVLRNGPDALAAAFDCLRGRTRTGRPYYSTDLGPFFAWLRTVQDTPALTEMLSAVRLYVFRHYPVKPDQEVLGERPAGITHITFDEARARAKLGTAFLKRLFAHITGIPLNEAGSLTEITVDDLDYVLGFWAGLCNLQDAARMLGIQPSQVKSLIELGVFSALRFGSSLRYLHRAEVSDLLRAVEALSAADGGSGFVPLKTFSTSRKIGIARIVAAWHSGELQGQIARGEGKGLQALFLQPDAFCQKVPTPRHGDPNLAEAARYLRISLSAVRTLRDVGILQQVRKRNADTNFRQGYISSESLRSFERNHVTLGQLAERNAVAPMHLARRLDRDGIPALDTPRGMVRVYHQEMLPTDLLFGVNIPLRDSGAFQQGGLP